MISYSNRYEPSAPLFMKYSLLPIDKVSIFQTFLFMFKFENANKTFPILFIIFLILTFTLNPLGKEIMSMHIATSLKSSLYYLFYFLLGQFLFLSLYCTAAPFVHLYYFVLFLLNCQPD